MNIKELKPHLVDEPDENDCWNWLGFVNNTGYGTVRFNGKMQKAHRVSFELSNGHIDPNLDVDHKCWNTICVNPTHLQQMTNKENCARRLERNTHCKHGHPFDEENTGYTGKRRYCRTCSRTANNKSYWLRT